jgi:hypothetical protein
MATKVLGKVAMIPKGTWTAGTYNRNEYIYHEALNASFVALHDGVTSEPSGYEDTTDWHLLCRGIGVTTDNNFTDAYKTKLDDIPTPSTIISNIQANVANGYVGIGSDGKINNSEIISMENTVSNQGTQISNIQNNLSTVLGTWNIYTPTNANTTDFTTFVGRIKLNKTLGLMTVEFICNTDIAIGKALNGNVACINLPFKLPPNVNYGVYMANILDMYNVSKNFNYFATTGAIVTSDAQGNAVWSAIMENYGTAGFNTCAISANVTINISDWGIITN